MRNVLNQLRGRSPANSDEAGERDARFYDRLYAKSASYRGHYTKSHYYFLWAVIADRLRQANLRRVLEIGCGPGQLAAMLFDLNLVDAFTGLDFSPGAVALARGNAPRGCFEVDDARSTTLHERCEHDAIVCTEVLEHVEDDFEVLARFRPGKRCLCSVPSFPYESHVRHFPDEASVSARYASYFDGLQIAPYRSPTDPNDWFFLMDGARAATRP